VALKQYFSHLGLVIYLFTHRTETGTAKGGRLLIATHTDQSNHLANQQQVLGFAVPFASFSILCKDHSAEPNRHVLTFLHPTFMVQCTGRVALITSNIIIDPPHCERL
jgi:hypothetical protein